MIPQEAVMDPHAALTPAERDDFRRRLEARLASVDSRTADVFAFRPVSRPIVVVTGALYFLFGRAPMKIPDAYFTDPAVMTNSQERTQYEQLLAVDDDFVPYVMPWFGTVVAASAFGSRVEFPPRQDPAVDPAWYPVQTPADIRKLGLPDPHRDGLMPAVLRNLLYMKEHSVLPVGITDFQGPLTTANQLMGYEKLIYLMYDDPVAAHELMDKITTGLIDWVATQKAVIGEAAGYCFSDQQVYTGPNAGVWFSDDDAVLMAAELYREFVVPYNSRILRAFGGGIIHFCGNATQHADNFLRTDGLLGLNIFALHNLESVARLQERVRGRLVLFVCDFTPIDYGAYIDELVSSIDPRGIAILSEYSPVLGLRKDGRYDAISRSPAGARDVHERFVAAYARAAKARGRGQE